MTIIHIVLFKFKDSVGEVEVQEICDHMLSLKTKCLHPSTNESYIISSSGGKDNSPEGFQKGLTHGFVVEFVSKEDRDYYVEKDPAHQEFVGQHSKNIDDVTVVDYEKEVY